MSTTIDLWSECVAQSLETHGVAASPEQIKAIASDMASGASFMAETSSPRPENPYKRELDIAQNALKEEQSLVFCRECSGRGFISEFFGPVGRGSTSQCWKCCGRGKHK